MTNDRQSYDFLFTYNSNHGGSIWLGSRDTDDVFSRPRGRLAMSGGHTATLVGGFDFRYEFPFSSLQKT